MVLVNIEYIQYIVTQICSLYYIKCIDDSEQKSDLSMKYFSNILMAIFFILSYEDKKYYICICVFNCIFVLS